jgi:hypothetical protein
MFRGVKEWNGIFAELKNASGCEKHNIEFVGSESAMQKLSAKCPDSVSIVAGEPKNSIKDKIDDWLHWIVDSNIGKYSINGETIFTHALNLMKMASSSRIKETGFPMPVPNSYNFNSSEVEAAKAAYQETMSLNDIAISDEPNKDMEECLTLFCELNEEVRTLRGDILSFHSNYRDEILLPKNNRTSHNADDIDFNVLETTLYFFGGQKHYSDHCIFKSNKSGTYNRCGQIRNDIHEQVKKSFPWNTKQERADFLAMTHEVANPLLQELFTSMLENKDYIQTDSDNYKFAYKFKMKDIFLQVNPNNTVFIFDIRILYLLNHYTGNDRIERFRKEYLQSLLSAIFCKFHLLQAYDTLYGKMADVPLLELSDDFYDEI